MTICACGGLANSPLNPGYQSWSVVFSFEDFDGAIVRYLKTSIHAFGSSGPHHGDAMDVEVWSFVEFRLTFGFV
ncbi:hypothetical protein RSAG8_04954, partial [Rhizoctonia solani AG-8 WAC10335]